MINFNDIGLKQTKPRLGILESLKRAAKPVDVRYLENYLKEKKIKVDQATIYRILTLFSQKGLVKKIELKEGKFRYEITGSDHHHIICESCGKIDDISDCSLESIEKDIAKKKGFSIKSHSLEFYGLCKNCKN